MPRQVVDQCPPDAPPPGGFCGVHRIELDIEFVRLLQRSDPEQLAVLADAEQRNVGRGQPGEVQRTYVLGRGVLSREGQVIRKERLHIRSSRSVLFNNENTHAGILPESGKVYFAWACERGHSRSGVRFGCMRW
jgi:hypothetical protein